MHQHKFPFFASTWHNISVSNITLSCSTFTPRLSIGNKQNEGDLYFHPEEDARNATPCPAKPGIQRALNDAEANRDIGDFKNCALNMQRQIAIVQGYAR